MRKAGEDEKHASPPAFGKEKGQKEEKEGKSEKSCAGGGI